MSIQSEADYHGLQLIGRIVAAALAAMQRHLAPGRTTAELDAVCRATLTEMGARPTPEHAYGFPGAACISVNDEVVHGIPGGRVLRPGDVVKLDVTADRDGYVADAARTVVVPPAPERAQRLADCARAAFARALDVATAGTPIRAVGRAVEAEVLRHGYRVIRELSGHGVGRQIHEPPSIPNYDEPRCRGRFTEGLVITVEPILAAGSGKAFNCRDGWTIKTADRSLAAHHEETIVITRGRPLILTAEAS
jgi:methionyl aminopeptidase